MDFSEFTSLSSFHEPKKVTIEEIPCDNIMDFPFDELLNKQACDRYRVCNNQNTDSPLFDLSDNSNNGNSNGNGNGTTTKPTPTPTPTKPDPPSTGDDGGNDQMYYFSIFLTLILILMLIFAALITTVKKSSALASALGLAITVIYTLFTTWRVLIIRRRE